MSNNNTDLSQTGEDDSKMQSQSAKDADAHEIQQSTDAPRTETGESANQQKEKRPANPGSDGTDESPSAAKHDSKTDPPPTTSAARQLQDLLTKNPALLNDIGDSGGVEGSAGSDGATALDPKMLSDLMQQLSLQDIMTGLAANGRGVKDMASYKFWQTQPVPKFGEKQVGTRPDGPIKEQTIDGVQKTPLPLIDGFEWDVINIDDPDELKEVYELLNGHYVEDNEAMFRFNYSPSILKWAMQPPGWNKAWHIGVRASQSRKLVAFISGIPATIRVRENIIKGSEVNFICVHKKLRGKRLAPVLIKEVTRRINLEGTWQAIYTAGIVLPKPVSTCRYYHRPINWQKLYEVGFSPCPSQSKPPLQVRKYQLPDQTSIKGWRPMEANDVDAVHSLLDRYLKRFDLVPIMDKAELTHWMLNCEPPETQVVFSYVVENDGKITDFISFYCLESSVIGNKKHKIVKAAYLWYYATEAGLTIPVKKDSLANRLNELIHDTLVTCKQHSFDVLNALTQMDNALFLQEQKFGPGDGQLHYYLYNYYTNFIRGGVDRKNQLDKEGLSGIGFVML